AAARRQALENLAFAAFAASNRVTLRESGMPASPHFVGRALTGVFTAAAFRRLLELLPDGTSELMMHPGYVDAALDAVRTRLRGERAEEVRLLTDASTSEWIARQGITLVRHGEADHNRETTIQ